MNKHHARSRTSSLQRHDMPMLRYYKGDILPYYRAALPRSKTPVCFLKPLTRKNYLTSFAFAFAFVFAMPSLPINLLFLAFVSSSSFELKFTLQLPPHLPPLFLSPLTLLRYGSAAQTLSLSSLIVSPLSLPFTPFIVSLPALMRFFLLCPRSPSPFFFPASFLSCSAPSLAEKSFHLRQPSKSMRACMQPHSMTLRSSQTKLTGCDGC